MRMSVVQGNQWLDQCKNNNGRVLECVYVCGDVDADKWKSNSAEVRIGMSWNRCEPVLRVYSY